MAATPPAEPDAAGRTLLIDRVFEAPRRLVFRCWTDPARAAVWWGPRGFELLQSEMDVRPGGAWRRVMRSPEGELCRKRGIYREVVEPELLVFTYLDEDAAGRPGHETLVTVRFADLAGKTRLTLHQALFQTVEARNSHQGGWSSCLDRFADYVAREGLA